MTTVGETAQGIRATLEPFIRPREEATHIRRILAAHLASCLKSEDALKGSLALVDGSCDVAPSSEARGLQREYLRALQANVEARRAFDEARRAAGQPQEQTAKGRGDAGSGRAKDASLLEDHLAGVKLARQRERLQAVQQSLDTLMQKPASAAEDFLQPEAIYTEATLTLPPIPKAVVEGLTEDAAAEREGESPATATADLRKLATQLEKSVLRAQLLQRQEAKRLEAARERITAQISDSDSIPADVKLKALGKARDELIAWMETELGNAGGEGEDEDEDEDEGNEMDGSSARQLRQSLLGDGDGNQGQQRTEEKMAAIHDKYGQYVEARRELVRMTAASKTVTPSLLFANKPNLQPGMAKRAERSERTEREEKGESTDSAASRTAISHILLTPYLERMQAVAHEQKAGIASKAYHHTLLARRIADNCQTLDHLADESQLLLRHPQRGGLPRGGHGSSYQQRVASAWTYAADSAKLATFEAVAEQLDDGQNALERAVVTLDAVDELLGRGEDVKDTKDTAKSDVWATLHGELGLIGSETTQ